MKHEMCANIAWKTFTSALLIQMGNLKETKLNIYVQLTKDKDSDTEDAVQPMFANFIPFSRDQ